MIFLITLPGTCGKTAPILSTQIKTGGVPKKTQNETWADFRLRVDIFGLTSTGELIEAENSEAKACETKNADCDPNANEKICCPGLVWVPKDSGYGFQCADKTVFYNPECGNGILDPGEVCDDGNLADNDGCSSSCAVESCGDGVLQTDEDCDPNDTTGAGMNRAILQHDLPK